jgi:hypothetical protein
VFLKISRRNICSALHTQTFIPSASFLQHSPQEQGSFPLGCSVKSQLQKCQLASGICIGFLQIHNMLPIIAENLILWKELRHLWFETPFGGGCDEYFLVGWMIFLCSSHQVSSRAVTEKGSGDFLAVSLCFLPSGLCWRSPPSRSNAHSLSASELEGSLPLTWSFLALTGLMSYW